jgi:hypothetical protein
MTSYEKDKSTEVWAPADTVLDQYLYEAVFLRRARSGVQ